VIVTWASPVPLPAIVCVPTPSVRGVSARLPLSTGAEAKEKRTATDLRPSSRPKFRDCGQFRRLAHAGPARGDGRVLRHARAEHSCSRAGTSA
jgi:hypothetical protein